MVSAHYSLWRSEGTRNLQEAMQQNLELAHTCTHARTYTHIFIHIHIHIHIHVYTYATTHTYTHTHGHARTHTRTRIHTHMNTHANTHTHIHIHIHICTCMRKLMPRHLKGTLGNTNATPEQRSARPGIHDNKLGFHGGQIRTSGNPSRH